MAVDPVVALICELRDAQQAFAAARGTLISDGRLNKYISDLEARIENLRDQFFYTVPMDTVGASEIIQSRLSSEAVYDLDWDNGRPLL